MPPTPEQWSRIKEIVADALEIPTAKRDAFVQQACNGDPFIMEESQSLLAFQHMATLSAVGDPGIAQGSVLLGRYRVERTLGRGGFATTWLAFDQQLSNRRVVIKLLGSGNADPYIRRKFADELRALSALEHPNIIAALDSGLTDSGAPFIVTQFAEGSTLGVILNEGIPPVGRCARLIAQIGRTLSFIHATGIIHRDLKPENIIVQTFADGLDHVRLIDFGIASVDAAPDRSTRIVGSFVYMAPEQLRGSVSPATDIYALGVIAYEMLTGELPFSSDNPVELARLHAKGQPIKPRQLRPELSEAAEELLLQSLQRDPAKRHRDAARFAEDLAQTLQQVSQPRRSRAAIILAAALPALALVIVGMLLMHRQWSATPIAAPPVQQASSAPTLMSPVTLVVERRKPAGRLTPNAEGQLILQAGDEFRIVLHSTLAGHLYLFSKSAGSNDLHILFPSPTSNSGSSLLSTSQGIEIPQLSWFRVDSSKASGGDSDLLQLAWSSARVPEFEAGTQFANANDRGAIPEGTQRTTILELLKAARPFAVAGSELRLSADNKTLLIGQLQILHAKKESQAVAQPPLVTLSTREMTKL